MGSPVEETNPEFGFERFDLKGDRGLGKEKTFRSLTKIQMFSNGAKDLETKVFQLGHVMIVYGNELAGESIISHLLSGLPSESGTIGSGSPSFQRHHSERISWP